jgi:menaquinone-dependent protoporphyrinogen oxidase
MPTRVLVTYATKHGSTREIAEAIGRSLQDAGVEADVLAARTVKEVESYDAVILGSALYAAHWQREANRFVAHHLPALQARPVWLFSSGPLDWSAETTRLPLTPQVAATTDAIGARDHRTFGGRLLADTPGIDPRIIATHPIGDFRDWTAIEAWAMRIAREILAPASDR